MDKSHKRMKTHRWFGIPAYFAACYLLTFLLVSQFIGLIGIPMHIHKEVTLHSEETFHHLFLVSSLQNQSGMLYTVNNAKQYNLTPDETIAVSPESDFTGTIHVDKLKNDSVTLDFHLERSQTINIVIGIVAIILLIPCYFFHNRFWLFIFNKARNRT